MEELEFNRKAYNKAAEAYEQKRKSPQDGDWNDFLERPAMESRLKPLVKSKRVLDLGCGTGLLTQKIKQWGGSVSGVDLSDKMVEIGKKNFPEIDLRVADATALGFKKKEFDVVASSLVMHYIKDLSLAFNEVARVLKPSGQFIFSIHHPFNECFDWSEVRSGSGSVFQPYFNNDAYHWKMCGVELLSFHHTFENIIDSLQKSGFLLSNLIECRPDKSAKEVFKDYDTTSAYPTFCVFDAVLK